MAAASVCNCGRVIEQPKAGRRRKYCLICSPQDDGKSKAKRALAAVGALPPVQPVEPPALVVATRAELEQAGRSETPEGIVVLTLAAQIAAGGGTAAGLAALIREFHASKARALAGADADADVIDGIFGAESG
jgi:hypothetical protein